MRCRGRSGIAAAVVLGLALALAGCSLVRPEQEPAKPGRSGAAPQTAPADAPELGRFYGQRLRWRDCGPAECAALTVPLDYAEPAGETLEIEVLRVAAARPRDRIGSLVVNPGGPGGSGVDYAAAADFIVGKPVRQRFDVVGFDPRGVGRSAPIDCVDDRGLDAFLGMDPTPDTEAEEQEFAASAQRFAQACRANAGPLLAHVSTVEAARDLDILRAALGESGLHYLGKSYGTYLGAVYAELFPTSVGRFVLDGALAPDLTSAEVNRGQAEGFELATRAYAADCVEEGECPLGDSTEEAMEGLRAFLAEVDASPLPSGDRAAPRLTEGWAALGIAAAMYDQGSWGLLTEALREAIGGGDGSALMRLANTYADRTDEGRYTGNIMEVIYAVNCLDKPESADPAVYERQAEQFAATAPTWGRFLAWSSMPCGFWPVKGTAGPDRVRAEGSEPIVVVGTTRDPATPYQWAVRLREQLANARLVTFDGDGHTAYARSNRCVDDAIDAFYVKGSVPRDGLRC